MRAEGLVDAVMEERKVLGADASPVCVLEPSDGIHARSHLCLCVVEAINRLPFVVKFFCAFQSPLNLYLVQDYYAGERH